MAIATFTLAIDRGKDKDGNDRGADFPRITCFSKTAELVEKYVSKGRQVAVQGRLQTGSYENKDGNTVYTTDVVADRVEFIGSSGSKQESAPASEQASDVPPAFSAVDEDDVPF